jgi:hypothetical protein
VNAYQVYSVFKARLALRLSAEPLQTFIIQSWRMIESRHATKNPSQMLLSRTVHVGEDLP